MHLLCQTGKYDELAMTVSQLLSLLFVLGFTGVSYLQPTLKLVSSCMPGAAFTPDCVNAFL